MYYPLPPFCLVIASIDSNSTYPIILVQPYGDKELLKYWRCHIVGKWYEWSEFYLCMIKDSGLCNVSYSCALLLFLISTGYTTSNLAPARHRSYWQKFLDPIIIDPPSIWRFGETFGSAATWAVNILMRKTILFIVNTNTTSFNNYRHWHYVFSGDQSWQQIAIWPKEKSLTNLNSAATKMWKRSLGFQISSIFNRQKAALCFCWLALWSFLSNCTAKMWVLGSSKNKSVSKQLCLVCQ